MEVAPDFDEFIACLTAHGVEFVIVGAYALAYPAAKQASGWAPKGFVGHRRS
jgi:hypothetical protein